MGIFKFDNDTLNFRVRGFKKYEFFKFWFGLHFMKKPKFRLFSRNYFSINISTNLSTYSNYEMSFLKEYKFHNQCLKTRRKFFWNFVRSARGKITFRVPPYVTGCIFSDILRFLGLLGLNLNIYVNERLSGSSASPHSSSPTVREPKLTLVMLHCKKFLTVSATNVFQELQIHLVGATLWLPITETLHLSTTTFSFHFLNARNHTLLSLDFSS